MAHIALIPQVYLNIIVPYPNQVIKIKPNTDKKKQMAIRTDAVTCDQETFLLQDEENTDLESILLKMS